MSKTAGTRSKKKKLQSNGSVSSVKIGILKAEELFVVVAEDKKKALDTVFEFINNVASASDSKIKHTDIKGIIIKPVNSINDVPKNLLHEECMFSPGCKDKLLLDTVCDMEEFLDFRTKQQDKKYKYSGFIIHIPLQLVVLTREKIDPKELLLTISDEELFDWSATKNTVRLLNDEIQHIASIGTNFNFLDQQYWEPFLVSVHIGSDSFKIDRK